MVNDNENPYAGPTARPSIGAHRRSARLQGARGLDTSYDAANKTPEKSNPSIDSDDGTDQINSSGNESFERSKNASNKLIHTEIYEHHQTTRVISNRNYDDNYRNADIGGIRNRWTVPESVNITPPRPPSRKSGANEKQPPTDTESDSSKHICLAALVVVLFVCMAIGYRSMSSSPQKIECPQFKMLSQKYVRQDPLLWKSLKINIENVLNQTPEQPSVFLLAYKDHDTVEHIMADIINTTAHCMNSRDPIKLNGRTFANAEMLNDYGVVLKTYRKQLESEGIMYVEDLHETPAAVAQAFHSICDIYSPFVHKSVIFFTFYVEEATTGAPKQIHKLVETKLSHNWNSINHDTLNALVGRVTDQVFYIHSET